MNNEAIGPGEEDIKSERMLPEGLFELNRAWMEGLDNKTAQYRFIRVSDTIFIGSTDDYYHNNIIEGSNLKLEEVVDGGFFTVSKGRKRIAVSGISTYLDSQGFSTGEQMDNRPQTISVFQEKFNYDEDFVIKSIIT